MGNIVCELPAKNPLRLSQVVSALCNKEKNKSSIHCSHNLGILIFSSHWLFVGT